MGLADDYFHCNCTKDLHICGRQALMLLYVCQLRAITVYWYSYNRYYCRRNSKCADFIIFLWLNRLKMAMWKVKEKSQSRKDFCVEL